MPEGNLLIPKISQIDVVNNDITFFFEGSSEPWSVVEFEPGTRTHKMLSKIESEIRQFNFTASGYISSIK